MALSSQKQLGALQSLGPQHRVKDPQDMSNNFLNFSFPSLPA